MCKLLLTSQTHLILRLTTITGFPGSAKVSNIHILIVYKGFNPKFFIISKAPFYVSNNTLYFDFNLPIVTELAKLRYKRFKKKLTHHPNPANPFIASNYLKQSP